MAVANGLDGHRAETMKIRTIAGQSPEGIPISRNQPDQDDASTGESYP